MTWIFMWLQLWRAWFSTWILCDCIGVHRWRRDFVWLQTWHAWLRDWWRKFCVTASLTYLTDDVNSVWLQVWCTSLVTTGCLAILLVGKRGFSLMFICILYRHSSAFLSRSERVSSIVSRSVSQTFGWLVVWLVGRVVGRSVSQSVSQSVGWLVG